jgi:site-specific DNA-methyltransferase (adenine-specific)
MQKPERTPDHASVATHHLSLVTRHLSLVFHLRDCVEGLREVVAPGSVDVVVTSPPYNLGTGYGAYDDRIPRETYLEWTDAWVAAVHEALAPEGSFFLNLGAKPSDPWVPFQVAEVAGRHFRLQNLIHWIKSIAILKEDVGSYPGITGDVVVGHYKPINSPRYLNDCHEYIFHFTKTGHVPLDRLAIGVPYQDSSNITRWQKAGAGVHCRGNTWFIPYRTIQSRDRERPHPASFPPALPAMCLKLHGLDRVRLVCDPFFGLGSTALACARLRKSFVGFEIDAEYLAEAEKQVRAVLETRVGEAPCLGATAPRASCRPRYR